LRLARNKKRRDDETLEIELEEFLDFKIDFSNLGKDLNNQILKFEELSTKDYLRAYPKNLFKKIRRFPKRLIKFLFKSNN